VHFVRIALKNIMLNDWNFVDLILFYVPPHIMPITKHTYVRNIDTYCSLDLRCSYNSVYLLLPPLFGGPHGIQYGILNDLTENVCIII
jgi:hypothetical protein